MRDLILPLTIFLMTLAMWMARKMIMIPYYLLSRLLGGPGWWRGPTYTPSVLSIKHFVVVGHRGARRYWAAVLDPPTDIY